MLGPLVKLHHPYFSAKTGLTPTVSVNYEAHQKREGDPSAALKNIYLNQLLCINYPHLQKKAHNNIFHLYLTPEPRLHHPE